MPEGCPLALRVAAMTGQSMINILIGAFLSICIFFVAQWLIPLIFGLVGFTFPANIVNIFALLIAAGCFWGWYRRG